MFVFSLKENIIIQKGYLTTHLFVCTSSKHVVWMKMQIQGVTSILVEQPPTIILFYKTLKFMFLFSAKDCSVYKQHVVTTGLKFTFFWPL